MSYLRRIVSIVSAPPGIVNDIAPPTGDPLTLGRMIHRRLTSYRTTGPQQTGFASGWPAELNSNRWLEAGAGPAPQTPNPADVARFTASVRQPVSDPREVAGNGEPGAVSNRSRTRENLEVARLTHECIESGSSSERAVRYVSESGAKDASENATVDDTTGGDPPSLRPANPFSTKTPSSMAIGLVGRSVAAARPPTPGAEVTHQAMGATLPSFETATGHVPVGGDSLDGPLQHHLQGIPNSDQTSSAHVDGRPLSVASSTIRELYGATPEKPSEPPFVPVPLRVTAAVPPTPESRSTAAFTNVVPPRHDIPQFESRPARATSTPAAQTEPLVQIGNIEIIIEAPVPVPPVGGNAPSAANFASRYYLRSL